MFKRRAAIAVSVIVLASACMPGRIDRVHVSSSYAPEQYHHLPRTPYLRAEVSGNPFAIDQAAFDRLVNESIQPYAGAPRSDAGYRVHMAFNGPETTSENFACAAKGGPSSASGEIRLIAAFCSGTNQALTYLVASLDGVAGPDDPKFRTFVRWATVNLFPPAGKDDRADWNCFWPSC